MTLARVEAPSQHMGSVFLRPASAGSYSFLCLRVSLNAVRFPRHFREPVAMPRGHSSGSDSPSARRSGIWAATGQACGRLWGRGAGNLRPLRRSLLRGRRATGGSRRRIARRATRVRHSRRCLIHQSGWKLGFYEVQVRPEALAASLTRATVVSGSSTSITNRPNCSSLRRITIVFSGLCTSQNTLSPLW
jgi:hypothetical protein